MLYLVFVFGLIAGSFLNVIIYRIKSGYPVGLSRSFCPNCKTYLNWRDLLPILSFIQLRGRCRYCRKKISWQYPIVEVLSGLIWIAVFYKNLNDNFQFLLYDFQSIFNFFSHGAFPIGEQLLTTFYQIFILSAFLIIAVYDFKWQIIPDKIIYSATAVIFVFHLSNIIESQNFGLFIWSLFSAAVAFLFFFLIFYFSDGRAMGFGDAKLAFLIGLFLGPMLMIVALTSAFIIGAAFAIILLWLGKATLKSRIAFGPFLAAGTIIAFCSADFVAKFLNI